LIVVSYAITKDWILSNTIAILIVFLVFRLIRIPSFQIATILLVMAFFYDIFWVFYSSKFFGKSVMQVVATSVDLPMKL
jgi:hypothetical protein